MSQNDIVVTHVVTHHMLSHFDGFGHCSLALRLGDALEQDQAGSVDLFNVSGPRRQTQTNPVLFS